MVVRMRHGAENRDAVAHGHRLDLIMCHVERGDAELGVEKLELGPHLDAEIGVEIGERLIHQEAGRLAYDRTAHRDPLPLSARQRRRLAVKEALDA